MFFFFKAHVKVTEGSAGGLAPHGRHGDRRAGHGGVLGFPLRRHGLDLRVKLDTLTRINVQTGPFESTNLLFRGECTIWKISDLFAVEVRVSPEGAPGAGEREHGQRHRNGDIHANLWKKKKSQTIVTTSYM